MSQVTAVVRRAAPALAIALAALVAAAGCGSPHRAEPARPAKTRPAKTKPAKTRPAKTKPRAKRPHVAATVGRVEHGQATWYASGKMTASGERFDKRKHTAAHRTLPFGTMVRVTHDRTRRSVVVRINDRGPFGNRRRIIDLAWAAARELGIIDEGVAPVTVEVIGDAGQGARR